MDRQFYPGFSPFHPFVFPRRRFLPFFFISPFFFPFFFRGDEDRDGAYYTSHHCQKGDTLESLARRYNCPKPILEAMNPHIQGGQLSPGSVVNIPRLDRMHCHKMYLEQEIADAGAVAGAYANQPLSPYAANMSPMSSPYAHSMMPMYGANASPMASPYANQPLSPYAAHANLPASAEKKSARPEEDSTDYSTD